MAPSINEVGVIKVFSKDPTVRSTYFKENGVNYRFCVEPTPDAVKIESGGVSLGLPSSLGGNSISESKTEGALTLGGMNPEVLLADLMLYRACELSLNLNADLKTTLEIYYKFLDIIERIAPYETGKGAVSSNIGAQAIEMRGEIEDTEDNGDDDWEYD